MSFFDFKVNLLILLSPFMMISLGHSRSDTFIYIVHILYKCENSSISDKTGY